MGGDPAKAENPRRQALVRLKKDIEHEMHVLTGLLKKASSDVGDKRSWAGPNAKTWHSDIEGRRKAMLTQLGNLIPVVQAEINRTPERVSPAEAKMMRLDLQG
ncbi:MULTISPECIES: hypothetical protein [unclassified Streptomyces]|uniref:hypothetical protein n=1 Tax=unclassified Streptomyces TaxID=2593676 RepID=UPI002E131D67|nr:hypothetical protein OG452_23130 [Streptomyces sp. NBC_01197]WSS49324.1 hypothetical protein OG708_12165 [Streptomyces sp. NBC_01180]